MDKTIVSLVLVAALASATMSVASERYAVVSQGFLFALSEPAGWKMDTEGGKKDGVPVVFYPLGQSWKTAPTVMYANTAAKDCEPSRDLKAFIAAEVNTFKKRDRGIVVHDGNGIEADGHHAVVKEYSGDRFANHEAVAYIDEQDAFVSITLSAKTRKQYKTAFPAFRSLVSSYQYATSSGGCSK